MTWFRRTAHEAVPTAPGPDEDDRPAALSAKTASLIALINSSAGRLPGEAVVIGRRITDTLQDIIATAAEQDLDVYALVSIRGVLEDYLPTTLRNYLALDPSTREVPQPSGRTPNQSLLEQLDVLWSSVTDVLAAIRSHDADTLTSQGNFLRTKFTGSDLDL